MPNRSKQSDDLALLKRCINEGRLFARHQRMAQIGAMAEDGIDRAAFSVEDLASRSMIVNWAEDRGFEVYLDEIANLSIRRPGRDREAPPIVIGGCIDTSTDGHAYEGLVGALIGLEVLEALEEADLTTERSVEMTVWSNTQGERFGPPLMGAQIKAGTLSLEACRGLVDDRGIRLDDTLERMFETFGSALPRSRLTPMAGYIEPALDAGPDLAEMDMTVGLVRGAEAVGVVKLRLSGRTSPIANTSRDHRRDPLTDVIYLVNQLEEHIGEIPPSMGLRSGIAALEHDPFKPGTLPERVSLDWVLYSPDDDVLISLLEEAESLVLAADIASVLNCDAVVSRTARDFDDGLLEQVSKLARQDSLRFRTMTIGRPCNASVLSGAGIPTAMILVPNRRFLGVDALRSVAKPDIGHAARLIAALAYQQATE